MQGLARELERQGLRDNFLTDSRHRSEHLCYHYMLLASEFQIREHLTYQNPYMEQQFPLGQFPQTVLPFEAPQVPSVVVALGFGGVVPLTGPIMGSAEVVVGGWP